jgi:hypothetical protein
MYEIKQMSDMLTGATLIITIEESELDRKALYTIQETMPGFLLPFNMRHIDGKIEFMYQITTQCNLQYITGDCTAKEYAELWGNILSPLLECDDWFMKIQSFVLDVEHLYYDKEKKAICFVYIPTMRDCSDYDELKNMAGELAKQISVMDMVLENKALRMIMNDFKPREFLNMLNEYIPQMEQATMTLPARAPQIEAAQTGTSQTGGLAAKAKQDGTIAYKLMPKEYAEKPAKEYVNDKATSIQEDSAFVVFEPENDSYGDIAINIPPDGKKKKKQKEKKKSLVKNEKLKKKEAKKAISVKNANTVAKAGYEPFDEELPARFETAPLQEIQLKNPQIQNIQLQDVQPAQENELYDDATQCIRIDDCECGLRLIGSPLLPSLIKLKIQDGELFTIGRFDATVGRQQSSFEFERKTKAISRRHAAIKRQANSYSLIDLSSSAGTFLNGQKLPPNTPFELKNDTRISFGTSGADYVFELRIEN